MLGLSIRTQHMRSLFGALLDTRAFTSVAREGTMTSLVGNTTIEICGASFIADEESLFGAVNHDYVAREELWYHSQSLNVNDIPGGPPAVWKAVADKDGFINSNYGWCVFSGENLSGHGGPGYLGQYDLVLKELQQNAASRRAIMIYTRPSMWLDYSKNGRSDFMCTNAVQYLIRDGKIHAIVQMRSNDAIFGFRNDLAWQKHILEGLCRDLNIPVGNIHWQVGSLHVYARHYYLVDHFNKTGATHISKEDYKNLYPDSEFV